jgi:hypothetical protein
LQWKLGCKYFWFGLFIFLSSCLPVFLSFFLSASLSVCLSVFLSFCLSVSLLCLPVSLLHVYVSTSLPFHSNYINMHFPRIDTASIHFSGTFWQPTFWSASPCSSWPGSLPMSGTTPIPVTLRTTWWKTSSPSPTRSGSLLELFWDRYHIT